MGRLKRALLERKATNANSTASRCGDDPANCSDDTGKKQNVSVRDVVLERKSRFKRRRFRRRARIESSESEESVADVIDQSLQGNTRNDASSTDSAEFQDVGPCSYKHSSVLAYQNAPAYLKPSQKQLEARRKLAQKVSTVHAANVPSKVSSDTSSKNMSKCFISVC